MYVKGHLVRKVIVQIQRHILLTYLLTQNRSIAVHRREGEGRWQRTTLKWRREKTDGLEFDGLENDGQTLKRISGCGKWRTVYQFLLRSVYGGNSKGFWNSLKQDKN